MVRGREKPRKRESGRRDEDGLNAARGGGEFSSGRGEVVGKDDGEMSDGRGSGFDWEFNEALG